MCACGGFVLSPSTGWTWGHGAAAAWPQSGFWVWQPLQQITCRGMACFRFMSIHHFCWENMEWSTSKKEHLGWFCFLKKQRCDWSAELVLRSQISCVVSVAGVACTWACFKHPNNHPRPWWLLETALRSPVVTASCSPSRTGPTICSHISGWWEGRYGQGQKGAREKPELRQTPHASACKTGSAPTSFWAYCSTWINKRNKIK